MLKIIIPSVELWDEQKQEFIHTKEQTLQLEHSLVSLSKWESKYCKSFLARQEKTIEETLDYVKYMTLTQNVEPDIYNHLTNANLEQIYKYIDSPRTATHIQEDISDKGGREQITSELIYYWMLSLTIPFECQKWHLNRLLTLIRVCNIKNKPAKKRSRKELMSRNTALNETRRKQLNTKG